MPIIDIQRRLREAGRIRLGEQVPTSNGKTRPAKLESFRFTSADRESIESIAQLYGGDVQVWDGAPVGEVYELYADTKAIDVIVPPVDLAWSQWMENWSGAVCRNRCDGERDEKNDKPCSCDPDNPVCKPTTRLKVIISAVEGIGTWRLETHGWNAAQELNGAIEMLRYVQSHGKGMVPARLMLEARQQRKADASGKVETFNFVVPVLDLQLSVSALTAGTPQPRLASGITPIAGDDIPVPSIASQFQEVDHPQPRAQRANAAATLPSTGLTPRGLTDVVDVEPITTSQQAHDGDKPVEPRPTQPPTGPAMTEPQGRNLQRLLNKLTIKSREDKLEFCSEEIGRKISSSSELTKQEASGLITKLKFLAGEDDAPPPGQHRAPSSSSQPPPLAEPQGDDEFSDSPY